MTFVHAHCYQGHAFQPHAWCCLKCIVGNFALVQAARRAYKGECNGLERLLLKKSGLCLLQPGNIALREESLHSEASSISVSS